VRCAAGSVAVQALAFAIMPRILLAGVSWYSLRVFPTVGPNGDLGPVIGGWAIWDTAHYTRIAIEGDIGDNRGVPAFFPLYSMAIRLVLKVFGLDLTYQAAAPVAVAIADLCFLVAVPLFANLVEAFQGAGVALLACRIITISKSRWSFSTWLSGLFRLERCGGSSGGPTRRSGFTPACSSSHMA
jgi:hypothetical protein